MIAWVRSGFLGMSLLSSLVMVTLGGANVLAIGVAIGKRSPTVETPEARQRHS